jgi:hypothetical protein
VATAGSWAAVGRSLAAVGGSLGCGARRAARSAAVRRWAAAVGRLVVVRRWVAAVGSCGSPHTGRDKIAVVVLSLCGRGCQNGTCQRAKLL